MEGIFTTLDSSVLEPWHPPRRTMWITPRNETFSENPLNHYHSGSHADLENQTSHYKMYTSKHKRELVFLNGKTKQREQTLTC